MCEINNNIKVRAGQVRALRPLTDVVRCYSYLNEIVSLRVPCVPALVGEISSL